ncbi:MAG: hypothetical protein U9M90_02460 [Patescibacteria group bacterium]|nr:hypothetical protein [Patescibacteria group bacterium]
MKNNFLSKTEIPENLPDEMRKVINEIKRSPNQKQCLERSYKIMTGRYRGYRFQTFTKFFQIFTFSVKDLWNKTGFMHCHNMSYLMRILLVKSGFFNNNDIENKWTLVWYVSPHQYLQVKLNSGEYINIDIWGAAHGIKFGSYAHGFH